MDTFTELQKKFAQAQAVANSTPVDDYFFIAKSFMADTMTSIRDLEQCAQPPPGRVRRRGGRRLGMRATHRRRETSVSSACEALYESVSLYESNVYFSTVHRQSSAQ